MQPKVRSSGWLTHTAVDRPGHPPSTHTPPIYTPPPIITIFCATMLPGKAVDFTSVLDGCGAVCDWPANYFYKQLMETYPDAKVSSTIPA